MEAVGEWISDKLLAPALVAVVFSWATTLILESHRARRDILTRNVDGVRDDLERFWALASKYWASARGEDDELLAQQILMKEADLRFAAMDIAARLKTLPTDRMGILLANLADAATGGSFGEAERQPDLERVANIRLAVVVLRDALLTSRNESLKAAFTIGH